MSGETGMERVAAPVLHMGGCPLHAYHQLELDHKAAQLLLAPMSDSRCAGSGATTLDQLASFE